jgi:small-conductance mechanosensitive channel
MRDLGLETGRSPHVEAVIIALLLIVGAYGIGWFVGARLGPPIAAWWRRRAGSDDNRLAAIICGVIRYTTTALLLAVAGNATALNGFALLLVALALGVATGLLAFHLASGFGMGRLLSLVIATVAGLATIAGTLGGMAPLIEGLAGVGLTVGARRFSLLGMLNFVIVGAVLFVLARILIRLLSHSILRLHSLDVSQRTLLQKLAALGVVVASVLVAIDLLGIDLTALAVFSGAFGLAIGFGLQKTFGNLISGLILLMDRSVKPGDVIVVGDTFGAVNKIGVRAVSVVTRDGKEHLIPNELLMTERVENWSFSSTNVRVRIPVSISYDCDLRLAQRLMLEAATVPRRALAEPAPSIWLQGFGESGIDHEILVWIADPEKGVGNVRSEVLNRLWDLFQEHAINLPNPQRDIHIRSLPPETRQENTDQEETERESAARRPKRSMGKG